MCWSDRCRPQLYFQPSRARWMPPQNVPSVPIGAARVFNCMTFCAPESFPCLQPKSSTWSIIRISMPPPSFGLPSAHAHGIGVAEAKSISGRAHLRRRNMISPQCNWLCQREGRQVRSTCERCLARLKLPDIKCRTLHVSKSLSKHGVHIKTVPPVPQHTADHVEPPRHPPTR